MKPRIRIIKQTDQRPKEAELDRLEQRGRQSTREITTTIKLWIDEFKERRRTDEQQSRNANNRMPTALSIKQGFQVAGSVRGGGACVREWVDWNRGGPVEVHPLTPESSSIFEAEIVSEVERSATP